MRQKQIIRDSIIYDKNGSIVTIGRQNGKDVK